MKKKRVFVSLLLVLFLANTAMVSSVFAFEVEYMTEEGERRVWKSRTAPSFEVLSALAGTNSSSSVMTSDGYLIKGNSCIREEKKEAADKRERKCQSGVTVQEVVTGKSVSYKFPPSYERISWLQGTAYAPDKKIFAMVTLGGEGFFYVFDMQQRKWLLFRSLDNLDLNNLAYDPYEKLFFSKLGSQLLFFSARGKPSGKWIVPDKLIAAPYNHTEVLPQKKHYIVSLYNLGKQRPRPHHFGNSKLPGRNQLQAIVAVDKESGKVTMLYEQKK